MTSPIAPSSTRWLFVVAGALAATLAACSGTSIVGRGDAATDIAPDDIADAEDVTDVEDAADAADVMDAADAADVEDGSDASDAADAADVPDVPPLPMTTTRAVVDCGSVCTHPIDAIPNAMGTEVYFTAFTAMGEPGVFRATVPAVGAPPVAPTLVASSADLDYPVGIALATNDGTLYVADLSADRADEAGTGAIFSVPSTGGMLTRLTTSSDVVHPVALTVSADGNDLLVVGQQRTTEGLVHALFRMPRAGATSSVITTNLVDPSGVSQDAMGYIVLFDARRDGPTSGTAAILGVPTFTNVATGLVANFPAGAALATDARRAIISGRIPETGDGLLTIVAGDGRIVSPASLSEGMSTPLGLHRARMADVWSVADESAGGNGQVFLITLAR